MISAGCYFNRDTTFKIWNALPPLDAKAIILMLQIGLLLQQKHILLLLVAMASSILRIGIGPISVELQDQASK